MILYLYFKSYPINTLECHGQINNSIAANLPTKKELDKLCSIYYLDLFNLDTNTKINPGCNLSSKYIRSNYYSPHTITFRSCWDTCSFSL
jgi:hypothetical protein